MKKIDIFALSICRHNYHLNLSLISHFIAFFASQCRHHPEIKILSSLSSLHNKTISLTFQVVVTFLQSMDIETRTCAD